MKPTKVALFGNIPAGTKVWLTDEQARSRAHVVTRIDADGKSMKDRQLYNADAQLGFKAGEVLAIEGDLDRGLEAMFGLDQPSEGKSKPTSEGMSKPASAKAIEQAEKVLADARAALAEATAAHDAETDPAKKADAATVVADKQEAVDQAQAKIAGLRG